MKRHSKKILSALLVLLLLVIALDVRLAQPEQNLNDVDRFVGFFLAYERMEDRSGDYSLWTEYGSDTMQLDGLGSVSVPRHILIGQQEDPHGPFRFPGMEGYNCFLALITEEDGSQYYTGYTDIADCSVHIGGLDAVSYALDGTVYFGSPLDDSNWNTENFDYIWTAYRVYQMEDGTIYLDGSGNSYGGVGGFSISEKSERTITVNGKSATETAEINVKFESVPRLENVSIQQYDADGLLLHTDRITQGQTMEQDAADLELPLHEDAAYVIVVETDVDGNAARSIHDVPDKQENKDIYFVSWFLNEKGMGYSQPIRLV